MSPANDRTTYVLCHAPFDMSSHAALISVQGLLCNPCSNTSHGLTPFPCHVHVAPERSLLLDYECLLFSYMMRVVAVLHVQGPERTRLPDYIASTQYSSLSPIDVTLRAIDQSKQDTTSIHINNHLIIHAYVLVFHDMYVTVLQCGTLRYRQPICDDSCVSDRVSRMPRVFP